MGSTETPDGLIKLYVDLPNHPSVVGESMWARPVGEGRYELRNIPFHAYDLNFLDLVETAPSTRDPRPIVQRVIRRSGHLTLRACFEEESPIAERVPLLRSLAPLGTSFEAASESYFAIDVEPHGDYAGICAQLTVWHEHGILWFETCGARVIGSFDARPAT